jgi:hypothetical protein
MTDAERERFVADVQANCDIADARHAADLPLCTYLLQMREFYRWAADRPFGAALARDAVGTWIAEREALWEPLQDEPLRLPVIAGTAFDPFDSHAINAALAPHGLLYGAGLAGARRPVFFVAALHGRGGHHDHHGHHGAEVVVGGREFARGLLALPAALADEHGRPQIVLRRDAIARWCWQRYEAYALRPEAAGAFGRVVTGLGLDRDFDAALPRWVDLQAELALRHELGELQVGRRLGPGWGEMLLALPTRRGELLARALRDQLADLTGTLPALLERGEALALHAWFAAYDGLREQLFPGLTRAYRAWSGGHGGAALHQACAAGRSHFGALADALLAHHVREGPAAGPAIEARLVGEDAVCRA